MSQPRPLSEAERAAFNEIASHIEDVPFRVPWHSRVSNGVRRFAKNLMPPRWRQWKKWQRRLYMAAFMAPLMLLLVVGILMVVAPQSRSSAPTTVEARIRVDGPIVWQPEGLVIRAENAKGEPLVLIANDDLLRQADAGGQRFFRVTYEKGPDGLVIKTLMKAQAFTDPACPTGQYDLVNCPSATPSPTG